MADRRDTNHQWFDRFDEQRMLIIVEHTTEQPATDHAFEESDDLSEVLDGIDVPLCIVCLLREDQHTADFTYMADLHIPAVYGVCSTCDGKGSHVNPSIDAHGLSSEDFDDDPDFREDYFSGRYDQPCNECKGRRVVPEPAWDQMTDETKQKVEGIIDDHYATQREYEAERRMGA